ncbi:O-acetyltransferase pyr7 [Penicillium rolfsii]|nr:O-acetyltransferase pyr7 [Penicillium rolfsii]
MASQFGPMTLTSIDHMMPICYITFFYSLSLKNPGQGVKILGEGLNRLVKECPLLAGNVGRSSENDAARKNVLEIQPASIDTFAQYPLLRVSPHETRSITDRDPADGLFDDAYRALPLSLATDFPCPIIRWQANIMRDGIVIAVSFHHSALDAGGFYMIQQALASLCRDPNSPHRGSISPCADLQKEDESIIRMANFDLPANLVSYRLSFLHSKIRYLRDSCNAHASTKSNGQHLSLNDVISGLLWRSIIVARSPLNVSPSIDSRDEQSHLILITEIRRKSMPALPPTYPGNAIVQQVANTYTKSVLEPLKPEQNELVQLTRLAQKVHDASAQVTDLHVKSLLQRRQGMLDWRPQFKQGDVTSTSLRRMPIYDLDFGTVLGKVVGFDNPDNRIDGTVCILPSSPSSLDSVWDIRITLPPNVLCRLLQDPLLQWTMGLAVNPRL